MIPKILAILPGLIPSTIINITTPLVDLHKGHLIKARVALEIMVTEKDFEWSDLILFCRNVEPTGVHWLSKILKNKIPYIYDIDDNFFELPFETSLGKYYRVPERLTMLEEYMRFASLVRVYSVPMFERAKSLNLCTQRVNGYVDWRLVKTSPQARKEEPVKIVYATSRVDDKLAEIFIPALKKILVRYGEKIEVFFLGYNPAEFKPYSNVHFKPLNLNYENYLRSFSSAGYDIGLAPLYDDVFHRSKTNLKVREYGASHIAGIYTDVDTYSTSVTHRENGLLVENTNEAWYDAISELIENRTLRQHIQDRAYHYAREHFLREAFTQEWYRQIIEVLDRSPEQMGTECSKEPLTQAQAKIKFAPGDKSIADPVQSSLFRNVFLRFEAGVRAKSIAFLLSYIKMKVQLLWNLLKIKLTLFLH